MKKLMTTVVVLATGILAAERAAEACGGCFSPPDTDTSVQNHRMVVALATGRTTLWDQIRYTGNPEDFVWVLPVPSPDTEVAVADPAFFDQLELNSSPMLFPRWIEWPYCEPPPSCPGQGSSGGDYQDAAAAAGDAGVEVFEEQVVGPYEVVTIGSDDPEALRNWLVEHGYNVPEATLPTIAHYTALGNVFVVMRLAPELGVNAMQPIRIRYPGYMATFPLKMVTVGASGTLGLTLWIIADQRFESRNYTTQTIDQDALIWDAEIWTHNYAEVFDAQIDAAGGRAWINEYTGFLDDLGVWSKETDVARIGLSTPTVTRLRTRMLVDHLEQDLELQPAADPAHVSSSIEVQTVINVPEQEDCPVYPEPECPMPEPPIVGWGNDTDGGTCSATAGAAPSAGALGAIALGLTLALAARRRRR